VSVLQSTTMEPIWPIIRNSSVGRCRSRRMWKMSVIEYRNC
jgi:hypothetical protein